jgi:hypothetical protein
MTVDFVHRQQGWSRVTYQKDRHNATGRILRPLMLDITLSAGGELSPEDSTCLTRLRGHLSPLFTSPQKSAHLPQG